MYHLLMRALHGAAADPVAQTQIFVVVHAPDMLAVVGDEALQLFAQLRRLGPHAFEARDDLYRLPDQKLLQYLMHHAPPHRLSPPEEQRAPPRVSLGGSQKKEFFE